MPLNLLNVYSTRNIGDAAILSALARLSPDGKICGKIPDKDPLYVSGLIASDKSDNTMPFVSVGGDIFNNGRPRFVTRRFIANLAELTAHAPRTFLFGQSIPRSCLFVSFALLAHCLKRLTSVTVRDEESWRRLKDAQVNASLSHDTAFALDVEPESLALGSSILEAKGLVPDKTALLSLRGFDHMYPANGDRLITEMAETACCLTRRGHQCAVLIQSDAGKADSDHKQALALQQLAPVSIIDLVAGGSADPVAELQAVLTAANIVIAVRYHTAILRLLAGRQPVVLSYSNKTRDLIDRLNIPGFDIDSFNSNELVKAAEQSAETIFDPTGPASCVRHHFRQGLEQAGYYP